MIRTYFDESGNHTKDIFVLAGWIGRDEMWERFRQDWRSALAEPPSITSFHHTDAKTDPPKGTFSGLSRSDADKKLRRLMDVICSHEMYGVAVGLRPKTFDKAFASTVLGKKQVTKRLKLTHHYQSCVLAACAAVFQLQREAGDTSRVDFVMDEQTGLLPAISEEYAKWKHRFPPAVQAIAGDILERSDSDSEPLQAADFLAGGITRGVGTNDAEDYYARLRTCHRVAFTQAYPPYFEAIPGMVRELELMESILRKAKRLEHWIEDRQSSKTES
jgi:hypothetical protein